ncbi:MAG: hypothetical protein ACKV2T_27660 [Kofleriaceae bacterium]
MSYDDAARALFQVPHGQFVAERKRLVTELRAAGDKLAASRISRLQRPPVTAWVVNQLYWHARDAVDELFALAARLRNGDLSASTAHREAVAKLRNRAAAMLSDAGHGANEATLRRIALTLSAVAAAGSWMPDGEGMLSADRDPPGFDAIAVINEPLAPLPEKVEPVRYDFNAPIAPIIVEAPAVAAPPAPKRNAIAELAAKRKEMAEEEKRRRTAERRGEQYVPPEKSGSSAPSSNAPSATSNRPASSAPSSSAPPSSAPPSSAPSSPTQSSAGPSSIMKASPFTPRSVPPSDAHDADDSNDPDDSDDSDEVIAPPPRPRTLSLVPPLPPEPVESDSSDQGDDDTDTDDDDDIDSATASSESAGADDDVDADSDGDDSEDDADSKDDAENADEMDAPVVAAPAKKVSALEQLRARKKQQAEEAEEERRRKFMEDGGTRDKVIAKRMMEAQDRNRDTSDTKRERVEAAVRAKLDAQRASDEAKRITGSGDTDDDDGDDDDEDEDDAPALTVERGGRTDGGAPKGPPQPSDLVNALANKLGAKPPTASDPTKPSSGASLGAPASKPSTGASAARPGTPTSNLPTGASPARPAPPASNLSTGASPARPGPPASNLSTGASRARPGTPAASPNLSTGASPARHVPETTHPPGSFPRPRTPSPSTLAPSAPSSSAASSAKPGPMTDAERRKIDARAKLKVELEGRLRTANAEVLAAEQRVEQLTAELAEADDALEAARAAVEDLQEKLDALD